MNDPVTTLIIGGAILLLAIALGILAAHLTFRFERKVYNNRYHVLRGREQRVTEREFQAKEWERDLGSKAHDVYGLAQTTLHQIDDETVVNVLDWEDI